jgi:hypothetical protein
MKENTTDPRQCERCGDDLPDNTDECGLPGQYLFLCDRCKRKLTKPATPRCYKVNPHLIKL